jgi:hypothetical protein
MRNDYIHDDKYWETPHEDNSKRFQGTKETDALLRELQEINESVIAKQESKVSKPKFK